VRSKLKQFPEVIKADIDRKNERAYLEAKTSFDQYVALQHALGESGGAIQMFHPEYLVPQAHYAALGTKDRSPEKLEELRTKLHAVPGVRSAIVDDERWFTNEQGLEVGGSVIFADTNPRLERNLIAAAKDSGFIFEPRHHGHGEDDSQEWSEANHAFAGVCMIILAFLGTMQLALERPPWLVRYGTVLVWLTLFVFLFIRADRGAWPLGPLSWWESFRDLDTAQHRLGVGLILAIAVGDFLRIRRGWKVNPALSRWGTLGIGLVGSGMLFTHLHTTIDPMHYQMVDRMNAQHIAMAVTALCFALSKFAWDTWQVPRRGGQYAWLICLGVMGAILALYVE
jgi:hypothetical protein